LKMRFTRIWTGLGADHMPEAFLFQGTPNRFAVNDYVARYPYLYWSASRLLKEIKAGDRAVIWRSGAHGGVIALGEIVEPPVPKTAVLHPEALGDDLWRSEEDEPTAIGVGIRVFDFRLDADEGMLTRQRMLSDPVLSGMSLLRSPQGTVFRVSQGEYDRIVQLWGGHPSLPGGDAGIDEGRRVLRTHYARERSRHIVARKKEAFAHEHGRLYCERCGLGEGDRYPAEIGTPFLEVHHIRPLSEVCGIQRTTIADLMLVCANCHRVMHAEMSMPRSENV
jgi:hypothetical protein